MARIGTVAADNRIITQILADLADAACAVLQMDTVEPEAFDHHDMAVDHQCYITLMCDLAQGIGCLGYAGFVLCRQRKAHTGDLCAVETGRQLRGKAGEIEFRRADQVDLRVVLRV